MPCDAGAVLQDKGFKRGAWLAGGGGSFLKVTQAIRITPLSYHQAPSSFLQHRAVFRIFVVNGPRSLPWASFLDLTHPAGFALFYVPLAFQQNN
jgi:hypothetical protein